MRDQLNSLKDQIDGLPTSAAMSDVLRAQTAGCISDVQMLNLNISNPPTQAQVSVIEEKLNEIIERLARLG